MASSSPVQSYQARIAQIQRQLLALGPLRPGSMTRQYRICSTPNCRGVDPRNPRRHGPYYQVNYVYAGKKTAYYVQTADTKNVRRELANYKQFRRLINRWIGHTVQIARIKQKRTR